MSDQGELSPSTSPAPTPSSAPTAAPTPPSGDWANTRREEQQTRHTLPPASRQPQAPNPNAPRPPSWDKSRGAEYVRNAEARRAAGDGQQPAPDAAAGDDRGGLPQTPSPTAAGKIRVGDREYAEQEVHDAVAARAAEQNRALTRPQKPEDFELKNSPNFQPPAGLSFELHPDDPAVGMYRQFAIKNGFTQDQFTEGLDLVASLRVGEAYAVSQAKAAEVGKLGAAGTARIDTVTRWLAAMTGDSGAAMVRVLTMCPVADTIVAFERLMTQFQTQGAGAYSPTGRRVETPTSGDIPGYETMTFEARRAAQERLRRG